MRGDDVVGEGFGFVEDDPEFRAEIWVLSFDQRGFVGDAEDDFGASARDFDVELDDFKHFFAEEVVNLPAELVDLRLSLALELFVRRGCDVELGFDLSRASPRRKARDDDLIFAGTVIRAEVVIERILGSCLDVRAF